MRALFTFSRISTQTLGLILAVTQEELPCGLYGSDIFIYQHQYILLITFEERDELEILARPRRCGEHRQECMRNLIS